LIASDPQGNTRLRLLAIAVAMLAPFFFYFATAQSIVAIWNSSETFAHGYIIAPISLWLIWQRRETIARMPVRPYWPALAVLAACGFAWLLAALADVQVVKQYAFVAMLPISAMLILGLRMSWAMAFPLVFLLLAVPFGDVFIAPLIDFTADFTVWALQMTGIPVLREGTHFSIPSGNWSVVEACSGVRYLISSVTLGCLYAYLTYRSFTRRAVFIVFSIIVPIVANGLRAYMIVMIGHLSSMTMAVGFDHLIYGWLFFGLVMFVMFWVGSFWREPAEPALAGSQLPASSRPGSLPATNTSPVLAAAVLALLCMSFWPFYSGYIDRASANPAVASFAGFQSQWKEAPVLPDWTLAYMPANARFDRAYQRDGITVGLSARYYRNQDHDSSLISSSNHLVKDKDAMWQQISAGRHREVISGTPLTVVESTLMDRQGRKVLMWHWYWIDDSFTTNTYVAKLLQAKERLLMRGDDGAVLVVYATFTDKPNEARAAMRQFLNEHTASLNSTLSGNKKL
jgi:exosortase A